MQFGSTLLTVCHDHVTYEFQGESTPYSLPECQGAPVTYVSPYARMWNYKHHLYFQLVTGEIFGKKNKKTKKKNLYFKSVDSEKLLV